MSLSYSQMTIFRKCPQAWLYRYFLGLDTATAIPTPERDFGTWWHAVRAADSLERGRHHGTLKHIPDDISAPGTTLPNTATVKDVLDAAEKAWGRASADYRKQFEETFGAPLHVVLEYKDRQYTERWKRERKTEHPVAVEFRWKRDLPEGGETIVGYIDEVYYDTRRKILVARDHKSHKELAASTSLDDMMDSQLQLYVWGADPIVKTWGMGSIRATAYDRVKSVMPKTPQLTLAGALSKAVTAYDLHTYSTWAQGPEGKGVPWGEDGVYFVSGAKKGQPKFGLYEPEEKVLTALASPAEKSKWYQRTLVPLNKTLIQSHLMAAVDSSKGIEESRARAEERGETARNLTKTCSWCEYLDLCRFQMFGGPDAEFEPEEFGLERTR